MFRFLLAMLATLSLGLLFAVAGSLARPLARVVRALVTGLVALLTIAGLSLGAAGIQNEAWWAVIFGGGILLIAFRLGWALRRGRTRRPAAPEPDHVPLTRDGPDPHWRQFEAQLDWVARKQVQRSRKAIAGFLAERESPSLTHDHRALLLSCEKRVPELIETCVDRCRNATARERDRYIDETLDTLNQIGAEAERARREVREADDRRLQVLHRYFDGIARDGEEPHKLP